MGLFTFLKKLFGGGKDTEWGRSMRGESRSGAPAYSPRRNPRTGEPIAPTAEVDRLKTLGLPVLIDDMQLAGAMGISFGELRWLAFPRRKDETDHYREFRIPKPDGGERRILAPKPKLKKAQRWVLKNILNAPRVRNLLHDAANGFRAKRSVRTNAEPHTGADIIVNIDLADFFETITFPRVRGIFHMLGYRREVAGTLAILSTFSARRAGIKSLGPRKQILPQGAPTSPAITNLVCNKLDSRLAGLAKKFGAKYTRYADDLTFSGGPDFRKSLRRFVPLVRKIIKQESFVINENKLHFARKGTRQKVTGVIVNERLNLSRKVRRRYRAVIHQAGKMPVSERPAKLKAHLNGVASYLFMLNPEAGAKMRAQIKTAFG
ncbi:MAG: reverse transcriptase family protein [Planctomycetota bacterium]|jgi:hypothetical protein